MRRARVQELIKRRNARPWRQGIVYVGGRTFVSNEARLEEAKAAKRKAREVREALEEKQAREARVANLVKMRTAALQSKKARRGAA
jgi:hypothetical protein